MKKSILMTFGALFFLVLISDFALARNAALYLKEIKTVYQANPLGNDQYELYSYQPFADGEYSKVAHQSEISLSAKAPVNGIDLGWSLVSKGNGQFDHCQVTDVFEDGYVISFCDYARGEQTLRKSLFLKSTDMVGRVDSFDGFENGNFAKIKSAVDGLDAGEDVKIEAIFANHKALVYQQSLGRFFRGGPYYNARQSVVDIDNLELIPFTSLRNSIK